MRFDGQVGLVTGAGSGIGRATALELGREGAVVLALDVNGAAAEETAELGGNSRGRVLPAQCDVTDGTGVAQLVQQLVSEYGKLDFAHNNAGISPHRVSDFTDGPPSVDELPEEVWDRVIDVNLKGTWLCLRSELAIMRRQGFGAVVNTASVCAHRVSAELCPYNTSKHAIVGLTKEAAVEFGSIGVRINALSPGFVNTPATTGNPLGAERWQERSALPPMRRAGEAIEMARVALFLLSNDASYVTGQSVVVDGGLTAALTPSMV